ncbi:hypothetical protein QFC22_003373 [Naganishia vaughanmartiniae]|uniref:Uncharacterized protein n=1 Tax=Naganishia vaughanmartiniae TaxID=1424756 RepID=A0ACC2X6L4_9TREE|nr:hypothetical protein QFC22_003373 [Naganishia vaughanmartiniae]
MARRHPSPRGSSSSSASQLRQSSPPAPSQTTASQTINNGLQDPVIPTGIRLWMAETPLPTEGSSGKGKEREVESWVPDDQLLVEQGSDQQDYRWERIGLKDTSSEQLQPSHEGSSSSNPSPPSNPGRGAKRKRAGASSGPVAEGYPPCDNVGNTVLSCFPLDNTTLTQGTYSRFIWNANYPTFIAANAVDAYLFHADSLQVAKTWTGLANDRGMCAILPDDDWWSNRSEARDLPVGRNRTWGYYFVVVPAGDQLTGGEVHQNTFSAIQTAPPRSVLASLSSASAASATLAALSTSSSRASTSSATSSTAVRSDPSGSLQNGSAPSGSGFPKWAIAVIVILGVLLALTLLGIAIVLLRRRTKKQEDRRAAAAATEDRGSSRDGASSTSPIVESTADAGTGKGMRQQSYDEKEPITKDHAALSPRSRSVTPAGMSGSTAAAVPVLLSRPVDRPARHTPSPGPASSTTHLRPGSRTSLYPPSVQSPGINNPNTALASLAAGGASRKRSASYTATASSHSDHGSLTSPGGAAGGGARLSGVEAAAVADAFRQAMRKPDFTDIPTEEGESPESETAGGQIPSTPSRIMERELSGEGVGVRDLPSRRAYMVEGNDEDDSDDGKTGR